MPRILLPAEQDRVRRARNGAAPIGSDLPAAAGVPEALVALEGGDGPALSVGGQPADVLAAEQRERGVGGTPWRAARRNRRSRSSVVPSSVVIWSPSAVAMTVVSPRVTMPSGATYCHSGPSWSKVQFFQVCPPSSESPSRCRRCRTRPARAVRRRRPGRSPSRSTCRWCRAGSTPTRSHPPAGDRCPGRRCRPRARPADRGPRSGRGHPSRCCPAAGGRPAPGLGAARAPAASARSRAATTDRAAAGHPALRA